MTADKVLQFCAQHKEHETLVLLAALSIFWREPQHPEAEKLLLHYRDNGLDKTALRETALQLFLLAGFQASLEAFFQIREIFGETLTGDPRELEEIACRSFHGRGLVLQERVYAAATPKLRENLNTLSPELERWTVSIGYGMVMSRPGLPPHWRELLEVAVLAIQGFPRQLHSHLRGALNLGATREDVETILMLCDNFMGESLRNSAWKMWRHLR